MKHLPLLPLLALLLLTSCSELDDSRYKDARDAAEKSKLVDKRLGFGFQADMTRKAADAKVEALRGTSDMSINLPSGLKLTSDLIEPEFARDTLAELTVRFLQATKPELDDLQAMLVQRYGQPGFKHGDDISWFKGPVEIELRSSKAAGNYLAFLSYRNLTRYGIYLEEYAKGANEWQKENAVEQAAEVQKL